MDSGTVTDSATADALSSASSEDPGTRVSHAEGFLVAGTFAPTSAAAQLSIAWHLRSARVPALVRFSNFSDIPTTPDTAPEASPRGIAVRFHQTAEEETDLVAHTHDGFPGATPQDFLDFPRVTNATGTEKGNDDLSAYLNSRPAARAYVETPPDPHTPYLEQHYYGVNAFLLVDHVGSSTAGHYLIQPTDVSRDASNNKHGSRAASGAAAARAGPGCPTSRAPGRPRSRTSTPRPRLPAGRGRRRPAGRFEAVDPHRAAASQRGRPRHAEPRGDPRRPSEGALSPLTRPACPPASVSPTTRCLPMRSHVYGRSYRRRTSTETQKEDT